MRKFALVAVMVCGCSDGHFGDTYFIVPHTHKATAEVEPEAAWYGSDSALIALALADFAASEHPIFSKGRATERLILVDIQTSAYSLSPTQIDSDLKKENWTIPGDVQENLQIRNKISVSMRNLIGDATDVEQTDFARVPNDLYFWETIKKQNPAAKAYIYLSLPGYSIDGMQSVLRFSFGPTPHGATATYFFIKESGSWKIQHRAFAYYV